MRKTRRFLLITLLIAVVGIALWLLLLRPDPGPRYEGRPLTAWLEDFDPGGTPSARERANEAVREIGTNAIPTLLRLLKPTDSSFKLKLIQIAQKQHLVKINWRTAWSRYNEVVFAFRSLGSRGESAVPALLEMYKDRRSSRYYKNCAPIAQMFAAIGPSAAKAVPQLVQATTDTNLLVRLYAVGALGEIHARPDLALPALIRSLRDPVDTVRADAIASLEAFGTDAPLVVPELVKALADPSPAVRANAISALKKIDPEAAAKAGMK